MKIQYFLLGKTIIWKFNIFYWVNHNINKLLFHYVNQFTDIYYFFDIFRKKYNFFH